MTLVVVREEGSFEPVKMPGRCIARKFHYYYWVLEQLQRRKRYAARYAIVRCYNLASCVSLFVVDYKTKLEQLPFRVATRWQQMLYLEHLAWNFSKICKV